MLHKMVHKWRKASLLSGLIGLYFNAITIMTLRGKGSSIISVSLSTWKKSVQVLFFYFFWNTKKFISSWNITSIIIITAITTAGVVLTVMQNTTKMQKSTRHSTYQPPVIISWYIIRGSLWFMIFKHSEQIKCFSIINIFQLTKKEKRKPVPWDRL